MIEMIERAEYTSREVYEAMQAYEYNFWNENTRVNVRPDGIVGVYYDDDNDLLFRLARLTPDAMYTDTGLTVSFILTRIHDAAATDNAAANLVDNAVTIGDAIAEPGQAFGDMNETAANWIAAEQVVSPNQLAVGVGTITLNLDDAQINVDLLQELAGEVSTPRRAKKRASKEKELNPGDTKLLDEYLHSFMKGGC